MNEEKLLISVNEEDVQNIINCYEKDLKELMKLQNNWNELKKWLKEQPIFDYLAPIDIKNKMQELEGNYE